jgi:hypothetical protein
MDKKAVMYAIIGLVLILVVALVVKPLITGQPLNTGFSSQTTPLPTQPLSIPESVNIPYGVVTVTSTPVPTTVPTWDKNVKTIEFVNPSSYGISLNQTLPNGTRIDSIGRNTNRILFARINGQYSATTQVISVPFPYWELWYSVEPAGKMGGMDQKLGTSTAQGLEGSGISHSFVQGSFSSIIPVFTLQVMDANDPNRVVRTITPPGGLDLTL